MFVIFCFCLFFVCFLFTLRIFLRYAHAYWTTGSYAPIHPLNFGFDFIFDSSNFTNFHEFSNFLFRGDKHV